MVEIEDVVFVVEVDASALQDGVEHIREDVVEDKCRCPECGTGVTIEVETKERVTDTGKRSVVLVAECKAHESACTWEHRLLTGAGMTVRAKDPRGEA